MKEWWKTDRNSMIESYLILKPEIMWKKPYYSIEHNIEVIRSRIAKAAVESGRNPEDIKLMKIIKI